MTEAFKYIGRKRRTKEDPRFVSGRGRYVADIALPGMKHVALVASPHAAARIVSIDAKAARAAPGVLYVLEGEEFCAATDSLVRVGSGQKRKIAPGSQGVVILAIGGTPGKAYKPPSRKK